MNLLVDKIILFPYWLTLKLRHHRYDKALADGQIDRSPIPAICIGNITAGGTGKTPHAEMTLALLQEAGFRTALLSRGYGRTSKGFQRVPSEDADATFYGDEPMEIKRRLPSTEVFVGRIREHGCSEIASGGYAEVIVLDDAFQYRALDADLKIVLVNWNRPLWKDHLLPLGRLRDLPERIRKANIVIVTKCPQDIDVKAEHPLWKSRLGLGDDCKLLFSSYFYGEIEPLFPKDAEPRYRYSQQAITLSAIAGNGHFQKAISSTYSLVEKLEFPDHHAFSTKDLTKISKAAEKHPLSIIVTTAKDASRLKSQSTALPQSVRRRLFVQRVTAAFLTAEDETTFRSSVLNLVSQK